MRKPRINVRMEHVKRKGDRRAKDRRKPPCGCGGFWQEGAFVHAETCVRESFSKSPVFDGNPALVDNEKLAKAMGVDSPVYNQGRCEGHADVHAELRKILDPFDRNHWNAEGVINEVRRLKVVERESLFQNQINEVEVDLDADSYIKALVKENMKLISENCVLSARLMQYDQRRFKEPTIKMWLDPDEHIQAENVRLRDINAELHEAMDTLLKKEKA